MDYYLGFCSAYDEDGVERDLTKAMEIHRQHKLRHQNKMKHFDVAGSKTDLRRNRMLDARDQGFTTTDKGLSFKNLKEGECEFVDKEDGEIYHLIVIQGQRDTPSINGTVDYVHPIKVTFRKSSKRKLFNKWLGVFEKFSSFANLGEIIGIVGIVFSLLFCVPICWKFWDTNSSFAKKHYFSVDFDEIAKSLEDDDED